jgi:hypothetical protein
MSNDHVHPTMKPFVDAIAPQEKPVALLYTTRQYPCGCRAEGTGDVPAYCPEHGTPP